MKIFISNNIMALDIVGLEKGLQIALEVNNELGKSSNLKHCGYLKKRKDFKILTNYYYYYYFEKVNQIKFTFHVANMEKSFGPSSIQRVRYATMQLKQKLNRNSHMYKIFFMQPKNVEHKSHKRKEKEEN